MDNNKTGIDEDFANEETSKLLMNKIKTFLIKNSSKFVNNFERLLFLIQMKITIFESRRFINFLDFYEFLKEKNIIEENFHELNIFAYNESDYLTNIKKLFPKYLFQDDLLDIDQMKSIIENISFDEKVEKYNIESKDFFNNLLGETLTSSSQLINFFNFFFLLKMFNL